MRRSLAIAVLMAATVLIVVGAGATPEATGPTIEVVDINYDSVSDQTVFSYRVTAGRTGIASWQLISCASRSDVVEASESIEAGRDAASRGVMVFGEPYGPGQIRVIEVLLSGLWTQGPATAEFTGKERMSVTLTGPLGPGCYVVTMRAEGEGHVFPGSSGFVAGTKVLIAARPTDGWRFVRWDGVPSGDGEAVVTLDVTGDMTVTAVFELDTDHSMPDETDALDLAPEPPGDAGDGNGDLLSTR